MSSDLIRAVKAAEMANAGLVKVDLSAEQALAEAKKWKYGNAAEQRVADAYEAIADGRLLIDLEQSLQRGGCDQMRRPHLAICPADRKEVKLETWYNGGIVKWSSRLWKYETELAGAAGSFAHKSDGVRARATAPIMPPQVRRIAHDRDLLFWEATWRKNDVKQQIVRDPALLEHVVGNLYVVKAAWELSELEAAALRG